MSRSPSALAAIAESTEDISPETCEEKEFFTAIKKRDYATVRRLLPICNVNAIGEDGVFPVQLAAQNGDEEMLDLLITAGADLNLRNEFDRETALFKCASEGNFIATTTLIKAAAKHGITLNVNAKSDRGFTALYEAASEGYEDIVEVLISAGANVNLAYNKSLPIHAATTGGHHGSVRLLLKNGSQVNIVGNFSETPLLIAARGGDVEMIKILDEDSLEALELDKPNLQGSPFMLALKANRIDAAQHLLAMGADVNKKDRHDNLNPILFFAARGDVVKINFLMDNGANIESTNSLRETPLILAVKNGHLAAVEEIIACGADVNKECAPTQSPPILYALADSDENKEAIIESLLRAGANLNHQDAMGRNILYRAILQNNFTVVRSLVEASLKYSIPLDLEIKLPIAASSTASSFSPEEITTSCLGLADEIADEVADYRIRDLLTEYVNIQPKPSPFKATVISRNQGGDLSL